MNKTLTTKRADKIVAGDALLIPQDGLGPLLVYGVQGVELIDGGKRVELTTDGGRKHVIGVAQWVAVLA